MRLCPCMTGRSAMRSAYRFRSCAIALRVVSLGSTLAAALIFWSTKVLFDRVRSGPYDRYPTRLARVSNIGPEVTRLEANTYANMFWDWRLPRGVTGDGSGARLSE